MSEKKQPTTGDVFYLLIVVFVLLFIGSMLDSCVARYRYKDLRERLERIESKQK